MSEIKVEFPPGVRKVDTDYAASGRYIDGDKYRFVAGFPEKIGGWSATGASGLPLSGVPRGGIAWRDNNQNIRVAFGTNQKLYYQYNNSITDITPFRYIKTGTLSNPFTTTSGSATVTVAHTAHGLSTDDVVTLTAGSAVGGLTIAGIYQVTVTDSNDYTITASAKAGSSVSGGGGTTSYSYTRKTLSNPFSTMNGSAVVTVTDTSHGAGDGDCVTFASATAVAGLTISGEYKISNVANNTYTIAASANANATTTGGGTPTVQYDLSVGLSDSTAGQGWGVGTYGSGTYGTFQTSSILLAARTWTMSPYGQQLIVCPNGGSIYYYDPNLGGRANPLYNAPTNCIAVFVTQERFVIAVGPNGNVMQLAWPDQSNDTDWTATTTNTANAGRNLQGGSVLVGGATLRAGVSVILSDTTAFQHLYTGDDFVFDTRGIAQGAGLIGPLAVTVFDNKAWWMSDADFWSSDGAYAEPLPSDDIRDFVFKNLNRTQAPKFFARTVRSKREIWFHYVSANATEVDSYVIYHVDEKCWSTGTMNMTYGIDQDLIGNPMLADSGGQLYNAETGTDANGSAMDSYITAAPKDIQNGDINFDIFGIIPDFKRQSGNLSLSLLTRQYPNDPNTAEGPYTATPDDNNPRIDTRASGKMAGFKAESNVVGGDWRMGVNRLDVQPSGNRR